MINLSNCRNTQQTAYKIRPFIQTCSDFIPWKPPYQQYLNAQPPKIHLQQPGRISPKEINVSYYQTNKNNI